MKASIRVSQNEALLNGSDIFGDFAVEFSSKDFTQEQREELVTCATEKDDQPNAYIYKVNYSYDPHIFRDVKFSHVIEYTIDSLRILLDERIAARNKYNERLKTLIKHH